MSERRAKRLRREAIANGTPEAPKRYFQPLLIPIPTGKLDEDGNEAVENTYFPRTVRRKAFRTMRTSLRKGRITLNRPAVKEPA